MAKKKNGKKTKGAEAAQPGGKAEIKKLKVCYKCGKYVPPDAESCPHCGAGPPNFNPAWALRIAIGALLGFLIWLIFYGA